MLKGIAMKKTLLILGLTLASVFSAKASVLTADTGWTYDQIDASATPSEESPWTFTLSGPGYFRITDQFNPGDVYSVYEGGLILTSAFNGAQAPLTPVGDGFGEAGWESSSYSHGS